MGMIGHAQFMNLCAEGDMGIPAETAALSSGMGWANLQFDPPWGSSSTNSSSANKSNSTTFPGMVGPLRRVLETANMSVSNTSNVAATLKSHQKKNSAQTKLEGNLFYGVGVMILEGLAHLIILALISCSTGMPGDALPTSVQWPGWEMATFMQLWNPLALSSTMAFSRHVTDYNDDSGHQAVLTSFVAISLLIQFPWLMFHIWYVTRLMSA